MKEIKFGRKMKENETIEDEEMNAVEADGDAEQDRVSQLENEVREAKEATLRRTAEMENMRRRFQQEREQLIFEGNKRLILDLLSTVDDLERTLEHATPEEKKLAGGIELVHKNLMKTLERYGVKPMESVGKPFDFNSHDALLEEEIPGTEPGMVTKEVQKGYMLNDSVLRHAKVIVSK